MQVYVISPMPNDSLKREIKTVMVAFRSLDFDYETNQAINRMSFEQLANFIGRHFDKTFSLRTRFYSEYDRHRIYGVELTWEGQKNKDGFWLNSDSWVTRRFKQLERDGWRTMLCHEGFRDDLSRFTEPPPTLSDRIRARIRQLIKPFRSFT